MSASAVCNIINFIQNYWLDFVVTPELLKHPTSEFVINFYMYFYRTKMKLLENIVEQTEITSSNMPKLQIDSPIELVRLINQTLKNITDNPPDMMLRLTDIYAPTAARTKVIFEMLCNLLLWFEDNAVKVKSSLHEHTKRARDYQQKLIQKEQLKGTLASEVEKHAYLTDKLEKLELEKQKRDGSFVLVLADLNTEIKDITDLLENRKLDFEKLLAVEKQLEKLILRAKELQQTKNDLMDKEIEFKNLKMLHDTVINDLKNINKKKVIREESLKEKENSLMTELDKYKVLVEQLEEEKIKLEGELAAEKDFQRVQMDTKLAYEKEISLLTKKLEDKETAKEMFRNYCDNMYASIANKEKETTKNFEKVLKSILNTSNELVEKK